MKALVKFAKGSGNVALQDVAVPVPAAGQVRIKVKRAGICQTDMEYTHAEESSVQPPVTLGHELSGVIDAVGEGVTNFKSGDRVIGQTTYHVCGKCRYCRTWNYNHCIERKGIGSIANGGFAEYLVIPAESAMHMPECMSFEEGALVEPVACAVHGLIERTNIPAGAVVVVLGPGTIGLAAAMVAKCQGAHVVLAGLTHDEERLQLAKSLGIQTVVNQQKEDLEQIVLGLTEGYGADYVVECAGAAKAVDTGFKVLAKLGVFVSMGVFVTPIPTDFYAIHKKEITIIGSKSQKPSAWNTTIKLIEQGILDVKPLVSAVYPLTKWEDAFAHFNRKEGVKIMLNPEE
ncbi:zinc-dependent alcohol dehydrogenase [Brevibacillus daliensis]|uniref:zinc-dependent alcohol dehydrogenase n=1 Tax=Brevibacillus daliensis TaxID=2892995 RepID=UPI001E5052B4|nr:zinc-binding dehydrogenase [Brevibacillus daliensis]